MFLFSIEYLLLMMRQVDVTLTANIIGDFACFQATFQL